MKKMKLIRGYALFAIPIAVIYVVTGLVWTFEFATWFFLFCFVAMAVGPRLDRYLMKRWGRR